MSHSWFEDSREGEDIGTADVNDGSFDYLPPREHDMRAFGRIIPDESTTPRTPENVLTVALTDAFRSAVDAAGQIAGTAIVRRQLQQAAGQIMQALHDAGYKITDQPSPEGWICRCGAALSAGTTIEDHMDFCNGTESTP
jgi:hypothetical protein